VDEVDLSDVIPRPPRIDRPRCSVSPPVSRHQHGADEPQDSICKIDPNSILHALDTAVAFGIFMDVHLRKKTSASLANLRRRVTEEVLAYISKDTKQHDPEKQNQNIPDEDEWCANYDRDEIQDGSESCEAAYYFCIHLLHMSQLLLISPRALLPYCS
jgi:hypothetical protein